MQNIREFLLKYKNFNEGLAEQHFQSTKNSLEKLFDDYKIKQQHWLDEDAYVAENFNVFEVLKIQRKEVITHTPVLAHLLNPLQNHSQGLLFYNSFIDYFLQDLKDTFKIINAKNLFVKDEYGFHNGQIDIFIHHRDSKNPFCIIIENKIDAGDQSEQLVRYYNYAIKDLKLKDNQIIIFYLTLYQQLPSEFSISLEERNRLFELKTLRYISYQYDIISWLNQIKPRIKANKVSIIIEQYINLLKIICL
jgi:hypothetical protein